MVCFRSVVFNCWLVLNCKQGEGDKETQRSRSHLYTRVQQELIESIAPQLEAGVGLDEEVVILSRMESGNYCVIHQILFFILGTRFSVDYLDGWLLGLVGW